MSTTQPLYREIILDFDFDSLVEAIKNTDIGEGSHISPISLDIFVKNDLKSFYKITDGEGFSVSLSPELEELDPQLCYLKFRNLNKNQKTIMTKSDWKKYFEIEDSDATKIVTPDGSLFSTPNSNNGVQSFDIVSKKDSITVNEDIYISYTIVLSFLIETKTYFFKIDPLVRISSKLRTL